MASAPDTPTTNGASARITAVVTAWPGVVAGIGERGEWAFQVGRREIGHLHGDRSAHFAFTRSVAEQLRAEGRIGPHPAFPRSPTLAARRIASEADVQDVIAMLRLNYERAVARAA